MESKPIKINEQKKVGKSLLPHFLIKQKPIPLKIK
jgi:hypothetical protein